MLCVSKYKNARIYKQFATIFSHYFSFILYLQLSNPLSMKPPLVYGTVPWTYTEGAIKKSFPQMYEYIKWYNKSNAMEGVNAVKRG